MWGVNTDFSSYELRWTIDAILQQMGFYPTTENPCVMMRVNHLTISCEYIIIYHDELYIALTTFEEIIHILKDKYKINKNPHVYQGSYISMKICFTKTNYLKITHIYIIDQISSIHILHTSQHPYIQEKRKIDT